MSWAQIATTNTPKIDIKNKVEEQEDAPQNLIDEDETCEEIFYMQIGTYLLDFISDLKYSFDKYYGGLLGKIQTHNIYAFFNKYIDFESSIKVPNRIKEDDSDSSDYEDYR